MSRYWVIDPGHGGSDPGAVGATGTREADITLAIALCMAQIMQKRGQMHSLTRSGRGRIFDNDRTKDLKARPALANRLNAECFVSIHCNSFSDPSASGFEVWSSPGRDYSDALATMILDQWRLAFPWQKIRGHKEASYVVLRECNAPAVLIEVGFLSNPREEAFIADPKNHMSMAEAIIRGIDAWKAVKR